MKDTQSTSHVLFTYTQAVKERAFEVLKAKHIASEDLADELKNTMACSTKQWQQAAQTLYQQAVQFSSDERELAPFFQLVIRFQLSEIEINILAATIAPHLDRDLPEVYRELRGGMWSEHVDTTLLMHLFAEDWQQGLALRKALGPQGALLKNGLLRIQELSNGASALQSIICVHPRIVNFVIGEEGLDHILAPYCDIERPVETLEQVVLPDEIIERVLELVNPQTKLSSHLQRWGYDEVLGYGRGTTLLFVGAPGTGKTMLARALANTIEAPLLRVHLSKALQGGISVEDVLREISIEARLRGAVVFFDDCASLFSEGGPVLAALLAFLEQFEGLTILATNRSEHLGLALERRVLLRIDFPRPDALARERIFENLLPPNVPIETATNIRSLATRYDFTGGNIKNAVMVALNKALAANAITPLITQSLLVDACEHQLRYRLDDLAVIAEARLGLDDVILSPQVREQVLALLAACHEHNHIMSDWGFGTRLVTGRGIVALFEGVPGTGKTLCAEVLGRELNMPVSRVNIPSIVSKWVGETEQHLAELFRRARAGRAILLFDEADALFGKRVENPERATDRYANMEINTLLQEIERYDGIVILTTNLSSAMDDAVKRRILFRITFDEPDMAARSIIWKTLLPQQAPLADDINFDELGERFQFPGGRIKNAVLRAAYRARQAQSTVITMQHLVEAATYEAQSAGQAVRSWEAVPAKTN